MFGRRIKTNKPGHCFPDAHAADESRAANEEVFYGVA
jgi:hypothetical protein